MLYLLGTILFLFSCENDESSSPLTDEGLVEITESLPSETVVHKDVTYKTVDDLALTLDLYLPGEEAENVPLMVWIHGGAWMRGTKKAFIQRNNRLVTSLLSEGYAVASIRYRLSGEAIFPAQIQDCNDAINFLWDNSDTYSIDRDRIGAMGRSAGGHLAALVTTSNSHNIEDFFSGVSEPKFEIKVLIDFFGPYDLMAMRGPGHDEDDAPEALFLGGSPLKIPDVAIKASPSSYVSSDTPPTILLHGIEDTTVPSTQSELFRSDLDSVEVINEIHLVEGARHGDPVFDTELYVNGVILPFLRKHFPVSAE